LGARSAKSATESPGLGVRRKLNELEAALRALDGAVVAFSGGVDSTFLLSVARRCVAGEVMAVTATSPTYTESELARSRRLARQIGAAHRVVRTDELRNPAFADNPPDRCYHCKSELFRKLGRIAASRGIRWILDGTNADDASDYRPGRAAAREAGVLSPLADAGLGKEEIRQLSRQMGLRTWDLPAMACLASRFPYGERITGRKLRRVERAEAFLRDAGFKLVRVRSHGDVARIEVEPESVARVVTGDRRLQVVAALKAAGFRYVAVDIEGYRTGSMNEGIVGSSRGRRGTR
jgi:uncharacterized protein